MSDATMCANPTCQKRETCHRATATPSHWQSYSHFKPAADGECDHYWSNKTKRRAIATRVTT